MNLQSDVLRVVDSTLSLGGRALAFEATTPLMGALPELDSMAVVSILASLEDTFGIAIADDEVDGETFATVGSLTAFVQQALDR
jgi:acyl carrier protein